MYRRPPRPPPGCRRVVGVDPSSGKSPWGVAALRKAGGGWVVEEAHQARPEDAYSILVEVAAGACLACIDAPITLNRGEARGLRPHERASLRFGFRLLPMGFPGMRELTRVGLALALSLWEAGVLPCETHPRGAAVYGGLRGLVPGRISRLGPHVVDAVIAAYVAAMLVDGKAVSLCSRVGCIVVPLGKIEPLKGRREGSTDR